MLGESGNPDPRMPITEVPNSPPPVKDAKPDYELDAPRNNSDYGDLGTDELVQRINELEDERRAARIREGIWIALLLHAVAVLLWIYGPRYILHEPVVVNPALKDHKQLTYLNMPSSAMHPPKASSQAKRPTSAQPVHPHVDQKTLKHFQAMRKAEPPREQQPPPPQQTTQPPVQQAQQQPVPAQTPAPQPQGAPKQETQTAQQATQQQSNPFKTDDSAGDMIRQAAKGAASGSGSAGANAPAGSGGMGAGAQILSDTMGVNFQPWLERVIAATYRSWLPIIPMSARPPLNDQGKVTIKFDVFPDGSIRPHSMSLMSASGKTPLDRAAWAGITGATYPPLPAEFKGKSLTLAFGFYYNVPTDEK